jgi:hypothetical protein
MCNLGKSGKDGFALKAINSKIDTVQVIIGELSLDSASTITRGTLFSKSPRHIQQINSRNASFIYRSGIICVEHNTDFTVVVTDLSGRSIVTDASKAKKWTMPPMNRGVYIVTVKSGGRLFERPVLSISYVWTKRGKTSSSCFGSSRSDRVMTELILLRLMR